jgi:hypothetical protein
VATLVRGVLGGLKTSQNVNNYRTGAPGRTRRECPLTNNRIKTGGFLYLFSGF